MKDDWGKDPYLYEDVPVLRNIPGVKNDGELKRIEGDLTKMTMGIVYAQDYSKFNSDTLCHIHRIIFGGLYDWAGQLRTINMIKPEAVLGGDSVRYAAPGEIKKQLNDLNKEISKLKFSDNKETLLFKIVRITASIWHIHPFREGNTRTVVAFSVLLAAKFGIQMDYAIFERHAAYVRNALVWCTQGIYSKFEYLERIYFDAAGLLHEGTADSSARSGKYSAVGDYQLSDYKEQPHIYVDFDDEK